MKKYASKRNETSIRNLTNLEKYDCFNNFSNKEILDSAVSFEEVLNEENRAYQVKRNIEDE